jgi:hypothetical protein
MEIEFKDDEGKPTAKKLYLQLKSGDSHLRKRQGDGAEIFQIHHEDHAAYWMSQAYPVFLVIADSKGEVRWMEIRDYLKCESNNGKKRVKHIVFHGERDRCFALHFGYSNFDSGKRINPESSCVSRKRPYPTDLLWRRFGQGKNGGASKDVTGDRHPLPSVRIPVG